MISEAILNRAPVAPVRLNPDVPPKLEEVINKALEKDRRLRYQSAAEIRTDLQRLKRDSDSGRAGAATTQVESKSAGKLPSMVDGPRRGNAAHRTGRGRLDVFPPRRTR